MARTVEQILQEQIGAMFIQAAQAVATAEALNDRVKELEAELAALREKQGDQ